MYLTRTYYNCPHAVSENARQQLTLNEHDFFVRACCELAKPI